MTLQILNVYEMFSFPHLPESKEHRSKTEEEDEGNDCPDQHEGAQFLRLLKHLIGGHLIPPDSTW